jgi:glutathione S-transferase
MKLIGSYTSPFVRKISVILLEKNLPSNSSMNFPTRT